MIVLQKVLHFRGSRQRADHIQIDSPHEHTVGTSGSWRIPKRRLSRIGWSMQLAAAVSECVSKMAAGCGTSASTTDGARTLIANAMSAVKFLVCFLMSGTVR